MALLTKNEILGADDIATVDVACPEWGGEVRIKAPTGLERDEFEQQISERKGKRVTTNLSNIRARTVAKFAVNADGQRMFSDDEVTALGAKSGAALDRCFTVWMKLAGLSQDEIDEVQENLD